jgi:glycosyltransferase involved in cell wall biosynthesis
MDQRAEIQQQLAGFPVTFMGYLSGEALATAYASADVFAFPSYTETFGQVVLEAMASGLPVVGLYSEGVCDLVRDGQTGLLDALRLVEEEQVTSYRDRLVCLIQDVAARKRMGQTAISQAQQRSWPEAMQCLVQAYNETIVDARTDSAA